MENNTSNTEISAILPEQKFFNEDCKKIDLSRLETMTSAMPYDLSYSYKKIICDLLSIHRTGKLHYFKNGFELSIPDPKLLRIDGPKELFSKHLYVNLTMYIESMNNKAAHCVKTGDKYRISDLLHMKPVGDRGLPFDVELYLKNHGDTVLSYSDLEMFSPESEHRKIIHPGVLVPVNKLPSVHPAVEYLKNRGFTDLDSLVNQFNLSYCESENPQYKYIYGKDSYQYNPFSPVTPQGKLIFCVMQYGNFEGWQSRVIDKFDSNTNMKYHWISYAPSGTPGSEKNGWYPVAQKDVLTGKLLPVSSIANNSMKRKYVIAPGFKSSQHLLGFDAAVEYNKKFKDEYGNAVKPFIGLVEGAFDAARMGAPFCSVFGSHLSMQQFKMIANMFSKIYFLCDHDEAGNNLRKSILSFVRSFGGSIEAEELEYPDSYKDVGDINDSELLNALRNKLSPIQ